MKPTKKPCILCGNRQKQVDLVIGRFKGLQGKHESEAGTGNSATVTAKGHLLEGDPKRRPSLELGPSGTAERAFYAAIVLAGGVLVSVVTADGSPGRYLELYLQLVTQSTLLA